MAPRWNEAATRRQFVLAGGLGVALAVGLALLTYASARTLDWAGPLAAQRLGTTFGAALFLLALGLLVVAEWPVMLYAMVRMTRKGLPALPLLATHLAYTFFPAVYGLLGVALTGETWWLLVMLFLAGLRLATSVPTIVPRPAAAPPVDPSPASSPADAPAAPPSDPSALQGIRGFVLDMDGVLYRGSTPRPGAADFIRRLNAHEIPYVCLTNNASRTSAMYQAKLDALGIPIDAAHVVGAGQATAEWLAQQADPGARVLVVGEKGLREELTRRGFTLVEAPPADYVVVGIDFGVTYERLKRAALAIRGGAGFVGANPDRTFPSEEGLVPGNGATLAFLQAATGVEPTIVGKPQRAMMEIALAHVGLPADQVAMIGDRLDTDILGGQRAGMLTILLRGGVTSDADLDASSIRPDLIFDDLADLLDALQRLTEER